MSTATITKPNSKIPKKSKINRASRTEADKSDSCGTHAPCKNCCPKAKTKVPARKKKKPMYKVGCWRGAFKGTLDF